MAWNGRRADVGAWLVVESYLLIFVCYVVEQMRHSGPKSSHVRGCNLLTFEDEERSLAELETVLFFFFFLHLDWARVWGFTDSISILDFIPSLSTCV